jgi:hypothetical protein
LPPIKVNFGGPWNGNGWYTYSTAIWNILQPFGNLAAIWYIFTHFGFVYQEKSGNPACVWSRRFFVTLTFVLQKYYVAILVTCTKKNLATLA